MKAYNNHILILGSARSGTSWFSEIIAQKHRYRLLFEPEHEFNTKKGKLICDKFLTDEMVSAETVKYLKRVFSNRVDNDWIAQSSNRKFKRHLWPFIPKKFIIKMVRGNLAGNFIYNSLKMPTVFVIRNPYEVLLSQSRVKFPWLYDLTHFENQEHLVQGLKEKFDFTFGKEFSDLEKLTIRWCIENCELAQIKSNGEIPFLKIKYEELLGDINYFKEICQLFNLEPLHNIEEIYTRPSSKTHPRSRIINSESKQKSFAPEEYQQINLLLDKFEVEDYPRVFF